MNKTATSPVPDTQLDKLFGALWPQLESQIATIPKSTLPSKQSRPQGEILEELVSSVRNVEMRVRDAMDDEPSWRRRRRYKFDPMMIMDMTHRMGDGPRDPIQLLIFGSLLKDELPWVYELALDAYRAIKSGSFEEAKNAHRKFVDAVEMIRRGPFLEEFGMDRKSIHFLLREGLPMIDMPFESIVEKPQSSRTERSRQSKKGTSGN